MLLLTLVLILRLPNLAEPYWYGDEAIYLTIGTALRHGAVLYQDIVDHKTPLIYYFAMVPGQVWFRLLNIAWMMASTVFFYRIAKQLLSPVLAVVSSLAFILLTALPWLEGHIPNGELFVMGFMLASLWLLLQTTPMHRWLNEKKHTRWTWSWSRRDLLLLLASGCAAGLGVLTKVPGILDVGGIAVLLVLIVVSRIGWRNWGRAQAFGLGALLTFTAGVMVPVGLSVLYYWLRGAFADYLQFGLLYNLYYAGNWGLPFMQEWLVAAFSLPAKVLYIVLAVVVATLASWWKKSLVLPSWILVWFVAALVGATLSNRPYPHYLLQVVPPAALALGIVLHRSTHWLGRGLLLIPAGLTVLTVLLLGFQPYEAVPYYRLYLQMATGQISPAVYRHNFNWLVSQNEELVPIIQETTAPDDPIFLWGTNPMLYAQSQRAPATRFTVAFHIHDLEAYASTMKEIKNTEPKIIVVMKSESELPGLEEYLRTQYYQSVETQDMILYRRSGLSNHSLLQ